MGKSLTSTVTLTLATSVLIASCSVLPVLEGLSSGLPQITNYPAPPLTVDVTPFDNAGCPLNEYGHRICQQGSPLLELGCWKLQNANPFLGGLQPNYPIIECVLDPDTTQREDPSVAYIYNDGCSRPILIRYAVFDGSNYRVLTSQTDLQAAYAPIESENEALSYALATTGYSALYGLKAEKGLRYFVDSLADTHVEKIAEGYHVQLFYYKLCGCGPHPTTRVIFLVTPDGDVSELSFEKVFKDPQQDDLCAD